MGDPGSGLSWRPLREADVADLAGLASACLAADGGQPYAAGPDFLRQRYLGDAESRAGFDGMTLACVASLRRQQPGPAGPSSGAPAVTTGLVHPRWRRAGLGGQAFDWAAGRAGPDGIQAETDSLNEGAHALYVSRGLSQVFAEDVMQLAAGAPVPSAHPPAGVVLSRWGEADPARFYAVYDAAFRERPGFPGWPLDRWTGWISDDEDFRPDWSLLATTGGRDVAFIACAAGGWIEQLGVVPQARGQDLGACLIAEVIGRMRAAGETVITLNVNINNPHAIALYRRLGFTAAGRRARYQVLA
jgi:mycothiol synthase